MATDDQIYDDNESSPSDLDVIKRLMAQRAASNAAIAHDEPDQNDTPPRNLGVSVFPALHGAGQAVANLPKITGQASNYVDTIGHMLPGSPTSAMDYLNPEYGAMRAAALPGVLSKLGGIAEGAADLGRTAEIAEGLNDGGKAARIIAENVPVLSASGPRLGRVISGTEAQKALSLKLSPVLRAIEAAKKR